MPNTLSNPVNVLNIAVIDDDPSVSQALRRLLQTLGCTSELFPNADDFLKSETLEQYDCLILDIQMPGLSGLDLQNVVMSFKNPIPIIFITAHHDESVRKLAFEKGAAGFLEKPFDDWALIQLIRQAVKKGSLSK